MGNIGYKKPLSKDCSFAGADPTTYTGSITHPHGAVGTFSVKETLHGISNVDNIMAYDGPNGRDIRNQLIPTCVGHMSLQNKTLTGPGLPTMNWTYSYSRNVGSFDTDSNTDDIKTTFVTAPDGSKTRHYYNRDWSSPAQGMQIKTEQYDTNGTTKLSTSQTTFAQAQMVGLSQMNKTNLSPMDYRINTKQVLTTLHHTDGDTSYTTDYQVHNSLGVATKVYRHNSATGHEKYVRTSNIDHVSGDYYVLQLPVTTEQSTDDSTYTQTSYSTYWDWNHSAHSNLREAQRFGQWQSQHEYRSDGTTSKQTTNALTDQGTNRTLEIGEPKRGKPKSYATPISRGAGTQTVSSVIDDNGWVTHTKDFNYNDSTPTGSSIEYGYDNMGRLTSINPADSTWADTSIGYTDTTTGEETHIVKGMFKKTSTKGGFTQTTFFDALLRPVLTKTQGSGTTVYQNTQFNAYNNVIFKGYPLSTAGNTTKGAFITFDGMQRENVVSQYGATGNTVFTYLKGNKRQVVDNLYNKTITTYLAYGAPSYSTATFIDAPEGVDTAMQFNQFGNITKITQGGFAEHSYFDAYQRLCQSYRADTGKTVYDYNAIGELQWYAEGASGATNSCSKTDVLASEKVHLTYDNLGRVKHKNFSNSATADVDYYYDPNGNVTNVNSGPTQWSYNYNTHGQTTDETLKLDSQTFELKYGYDSLGNQSILTYPSGRQISYAPNALGQPTKAGEFAAGASYHANGTLTDFTYGNGLKYNLTLDNRQLPQHLKTLKGSTSLTHLQYSYDGNGNTSSSITDHKDASYNIAMGYDGLDRLTAANGKWGAANFTYDTMGNIKSKSKSKSMGSMAVSYVYDPTTKRLNSASVTGSKSENYSFTYDKKGTVTNTGNVLLPRNQAGQVIGTDGHSYVYDGSGKRVKDTKNGKHRYSIYDLSGRMIYQWDQQTETITDYIFLGKERVTEAQVSLGDGSQSMDNTNVGYTGHQWDDDSGLNYMQARYYDPLLGRFLSNDPVGFSNIHNFNRYTYANNSPYRYVDLDGRVTTDAQQLRNNGVDRHGITVYREAQSATLVRAIEYADTASDYINPIKGGIKRLIKRGLKGGCSFTAETLILTQDGYKNIVEVKIGDSVLAKSDETGVVAWRKVTDTFKEWHQETITTTAEHPFFIENQGWLAAGQLVPGTVVSGPEANDHIRIIGLGINQKPQYAYNFTVDIDHTYFVGKTNMWVHNSCNVWQASRINAIKTEHIFSKKHINNGIMELGSSQQDILRRASDTLGKLSNSGALKDGSNMINTTMNGVAATVRATFKDGI